MSLLRWDESRTSSRPIEEGLRIFRAGLQASPTMRSRRSRVERSAASSACQCRALAERRSAMAILPPLRRPYFCYAATRKMPYGPSASSSARADLAENRDQEKDRRKYIRCLGSMALMPAATRYDLAESCGNASMADPNIFDGSFTRACISLNWPIKL